MKFNARLGKLGFDIVTETWYGNVFFYFILTEDGKFFDMKSGYFTSRADAEKAAIENIDYLCERFNYTR